MGKLHPVLMLLHFMVFSFYTDVPLHVCREERGGYEGKLLFFMVVCLGFKTLMEQKNEICQLLVGSSKISHTVGSRFTSWFL